MQLKVFMCLYKHMKPAICQLGEAEFPVED